MFIYLLIDKKHETFFVFVYQYMSFINYLFIGISFINIFILICLLKYLILCCLGGVCLFTGIHLLFFSNISYLPVCFLVICSLKYSFVWNDMYLFTGIHLFGVVIVCWYVLFILFFFLLSFCCCCCCCYWWEWGGGGETGKWGVARLCGGGGGGGAVLLVENVIDSYEKDKKKGQNKQKKTEKHVNDTVVAVLITRNILSTSLSVFVPVHY